MNVLTDQFVVPIWAVFLGALSIIALANFIIFELKNLNLKSNEVALFIDIYIKFNYNAPLAGDFVEWLHTPHPCLSEETPADCLRSQMGESVIAIPNQKFCISLDFN